MLKLKYGPYSPSRLETATCGYQFYHTYIKPRSDKKFESLPQARGSAVHEVFEKITARLCAGEKTVFSEKEIREYIVDAVAKHPAAYQETAEIIDMAKKYVQSPPPVLTSDAGIELRLAIKIVGTAQGGAPIFEECDYDDPEAFGRGRADIMIISDDTTEAIVYDHKTQPNVEEADTFQMGFYAWVISKAHPYLNTIKTVLHFARYGKYSEPYIWTREDLAKIEDEILTRVAIAENRTEMSAVPYKNCQYCPFMVECPAVAEYIEVDEKGDFRVNNKNLKILGDTNKAVKVAGMVNILEEMVKIGKDSLKEHVKSFGPIAIPGKIFQFVVSDPKVNWDVVNKKHRGAVYAIFEKYGIDPKSFMGFSQTFSKDVWFLANESLLRELSAAMPKTVETTFRGVKM